MSSLAIPKSDLKLLLEKAFVAGYESPADMVDAETSNIIEVYLKNKKKELSKLKEYTPKYSTASTFTYSTS